MQYIQQRVHRNLNGNNTLSYSVQRRKNGNLWKLIIIIIINNNNNNNNNNLFTYLTRVTYADAHTRITVLSYSTVFTIITIFTILTFSKLQ